MTQMSYSVTTANSSLWFFDSFYKVFSQSKAKSDVVYNHKGSSNNANEWKQQLSPVSLPFSPLRLRLWYQTLTICELQG